MSHAESGEMIVNKEIPRNPALLGFYAYPSDFKFDFMPTPYAWLDLKRKTDVDHVEDINTDKLWRVHDSWYDLRGFVHPGGQDFIHITQGTDITELVESSHLDIDKIRTLLKKYFVCKAVSPRNCLLDFQQTGFYVTLRTRVYEMMKTIKEKKPKKPSYLGSVEFFHDYLLFGFLLFLALGVLLPANFSFTIDPTSTP
ncbi:hypothetical protein EON65_51260, partial [archaeon]